MSTSGAGFPVSPPSPRLWHTTPLHYLPHLLVTGTLFSQERLRQEKLPVVPRPTAAARVRKLGLSGYVHLSPRPNTPLLADKRARGYPHALLELDRETVLALPGVALLKFNTKAWRHRDDFVPVSDPAEKAALLEEHVAGRYPSLEILVPGQLTLSQCTVTLHFASEAEAKWFRGWPTEIFAFLPPVFVTPEVFPPGLEPDLEALQAYRDACQKAGEALLPPPDLPFD